MTSHRSDDDAFARAAKARFDDSVRQLDAGTRSALAQGRQAALDAASPTRRPGWFQWMPAAGLATAIAVTAILVRAPDIERTIPGAGDADIEILLGGDSIEMLEDLEFYAWMEQQALEEGHDAG